MDIFTDGEFSREDMNMIFSKLNVHDENDKRALWSIAYYKATERGICLQVGMAGAASGVNLSESELAAWKESLTTMNLIDWE